MTTRSPRYPRYDVLVLVCGLVLLTFVPWVQAQDDLGVAARQAINAANNDERRAVAVAGHADYTEAIGRSPELSRQLENGRRFLGYARSALESADGRPSTSAYKDVEVLATKASTELVGYINELQMIFDAIEVERRPPPPPPPPPAPKPEPPPPTAPVDTETLPTDRTDPAASKPASDAPTEVAATPVGPPGAAAATPLAASAETSSTPAAAEPDPPAGADVQAADPQASNPQAKDSRPAAPPTSTRAGRARGPRSLQQAVEAYLAGDYEEVVDRLEKPSGSATRRAQALLLRAAARYALFLLGDETDYALRGQAADDILASRVAKANVAPTEAAFSPRFRDFYAATR